VQLRCANTAERIEVLLWLQTCGPIAHFIRWGQYRFLHGFDAAFAKLLRPHVVYLAARAKLDVIMCPQGRRRVPN